MSQQQILSAVQRERLKTNAAGVGGAFVGIGTATFLGTMIAKGVRPNPNSLPSVAKQQAGISLSVKAVLGVVVLMLNSLTGPWGIFLIGFGWGALGSTVIDVFLVSTNGGLVGLATATALRMRGVQTSANKAGRVYEEAAGESIRSEQVGRKIVVAEGRSED